MTLLAVRHLRKSYGAFVATDDVSLTVEAGELHAIIGPNGAGKTTLIHQLSGMMASNSGTIHLGGEDVTRIAMVGRVRRGLARSFQITSVLEGFSVLENAAVAVQARSGSSFRFFGRAEDDVAVNQEAMQALASVGLVDRAARRTDTLSHGEKRQLEIAIALATGARMLLLDEPLAGTGPEESTMLIGLLRRLKASHTIVLIEHDMDAVFALADRVSVLVYGRVIATGTPAEIRADPAVRAAYLGEES